MKYEEIVVKVPVSNGVHMRTEWDDYSEILVSKDENVVLIKANQAGLITLARHLLTLAQGSVPPGYHLHYDDYGGLEEGSVEMILERA